MEQNNCEVIIAGPGAGKTHSMVFKVLKKLPELSPNRFCAVITYTNAATDEIKKRLSKYVNIPENLFIGTTHSFLIRFFIQPYASILDITTSDNNYIDAVKLWYAPVNQFAKRAGEIKLANQLFSKGIITYDKVLEKSYEISQNEKIANLISNRLQFVFIDEYQDTRLYQHYVIKNLLKQNSTQVSCIGDPLQSIFKFTYFTSQLFKEPKPESFDQTPLIDFKNAYGSVFHAINYRSSHNVIRFTNMFNNIFQQQPDKDTECNGVPVCFVDRTAIQEIINGFIQIRENHEIVPATYENIEELYLGKKWSMYEDVADMNNLNRIKKDKNARSQFHEISRLILGFLGLKKSEVLKIIDEIAFRKFCFEMIKQFSIKKFNDDAHKENHVRKVFQNKFNVELSLENRNKTQFNASFYHVTQVSNSASKKCYSTIHSAKGLEATTVLVCAQTNTELKKWLETDAVKLQTLDDDYRLGYVAFSRAKELLCIACLQPIGLSLRKKLEELDVHIIP